MERYELSLAEQAQRREIAENTKQMLLTKLAITGQEEASLMSRYKGYYLQIVFSELHPLMVLCLAKVLRKPSTPRQRQLLNELNLKSVLGSHAINDDIGCYTYRATQWLDAEMGAGRFFEILNRCVGEADRAFCRLAE